MTTSLERATVDLDEAHVAGLEHLLDRVAAAPGGPASTPTVVPLAYLSAITPFAQPLIADLHDELGMSYATTSEDHVTVNRDLSPGESLDAQLAYDGVVVRDRASGGRLAFATFRRTFADTEGSIVAVVKWVCALMDRPAAAGATTDVGEVGTLHSAPVTADLARRWADWTRDQEPIHLDPAVARAAGLPGPVAHASLVTAITERLVRSAREGATLRELELRHRGGIFFGDTIGLRQTSDDTFMASSTRGPVATVTATFASMATTTMKGSS